MSTTLSLHRGAKPNVANLSTELHGKPDSRPPLVLLHQLACSPAIWTPCLNSLTQIDPHRSYLAIDLSAHGSSPNILPHTTDHLVQIVHQAVATVGFDSPVIVGHWTSVFGPFGTGETLTICVQPGIYVVGKGGARIGHTEPVTTRSNTKSIDIDVNINLYLTSAPGYYSDLFSIDNEKIDSYTEILLADYPGLWTVGFWE